jgi:hypothetical protein
MLVWRTLRYWGVRRVRIAICTTVLICGFVLPGLARSSGPAAQHVQQVPVYCGWIGVQVSPMTRVLAENLGMVTLWPTQTR